MNIINANLTRMPQVEVLGIPALLTPHKVSRATVHLGLYCYELQGSLENPRQPIFLMEQVADNFCGTLLTAAPMLMQGIQRLELAPGDISRDAGTAYVTPAEFEAQYFG